MGKVWIITISMVIGIALTGCSNPFISYYQDKTGGIDITKSPVVILPSSKEEPILLRGTNIDTDFIQMLEDNYIPIGFSSFHGGGNINENQAIEQAKKVHATTIYFYKNYTGTVYGQNAVSEYHPGTMQMIPSESSGTVNIYGHGGYTTGNYSDSTTTLVTTPGYTTTQYVPYSINRYDYFAAYWIKSKGGILGLFVRDLTPEEREKIQSNKGVIVTAVVKNSPAFMADILKRDIIKKIEDTEIITSPVFIDTIRKYAGKKVTITILRNGQEITKEVQLNEKP